jgi:hypothetical protein
MALSSERSQASLPYQNGLMHSSVSTQYTTRTHKALFNAAKWLSLFDELTQLDCEDLTDKLDVVYSNGGAHEHRIGAKEEKGGISKESAT